MGLRPRARGTPLLTEPEVNNCFSLFTRGDLNRIRKETIKKRLVWLTGEFMREHKAVNSGYAKVISLQFLQTWQIVNTHIHLIFNNYLPKTKLILLNNPQDEVERIIQQILTGPEVNNCFSIFTRSDLNRIRKETIKKWLVWLTGEFMGEHEALNSGCAKVRSLQYLQTWQIIVLIFLYRVL